MMHNIFIAGSGFLIGMLIYSAVNIRKIRIEFPGETKQLKIITTYWFREWAGFALSTTIGLGYLYLLPEIFKREIYSVTIENWLRAVSIMVGLGSQWIGIALFGVTRRLAKQKANDIIADGGAEL